MGLGSVQVIPMTMIAGIKPQCNAVLATGAAFSQTLSAEAITLPTKPPVLLIAFDGMSIMFNTNEFCKNTSDHTGLVSFH